MKHCILSALFISVAIVSHAQVESELQEPSKLSFGVSFSANLPLYGQSKWISSSVAEDGGLDQSTEGYTFGKGIKFGWLLNYEASESIDLELDVEYLAGFTNRHTYFYEIQGQSEYNKLSQKNRANTLFVNPKVCFKLAKNKYNGFLYTKLGPNIGFSSIKIKEEFYFNNNLLEYGWKIKGNPVKGFSASLGYNFGGESNEKYFIELEVAHNSMKPRTQTLVSAIANKNEDFLKEEKQNVFFSKTEYLDSGVPADQNNSQIPRKALAFPYNYSSINIKVGILL